MYMLLRVQTPGSYMAAITGGRAALAVAVLLCAMALCGMGAQGKGTGERGGLGWAKGWPRPGIFLSVLHFSFFSFICFCSIYFYCGYPMIL